MRGKECCFRKYVPWILAQIPIKIKDKNGKNFLYDKNVVALRNDRDILAVGSAAYEIYEKNPKNVQVVWPMTNGVIANLTEAEIVLSHLLKSFSGILHRDVTLYIAVPSDITQVEKRCLFPGHVR